MKIVHWTLFNNSGLDRVAQDLAKAEKALGYNSIAVSSVKMEEWDKGMDGDIHVGHSHVPDKVRKAGGKCIWIGHGTPEHCFHTTAEDALRGGYGHADTLMLIQWWLRNADALVTFWPRHAEIWAQMIDSNSTIEVVPLGVDKSFWKPVPTRGKYAGEPSLITLENAHYIKWPLDLAIAWPMVTEEHYNALWHCIHMPRDQHRFWFPFMNANGSAYKAYISEATFGGEDLRNAFVSVDYVGNFVRYGDFNRITLEAKACGAKLISFEGNPYADFWVPEGDQKRQAEVIRGIFRGDIKPRETEPVPDLLDTAASMISIYKRLMGEGA